MERTGVARIPLALLELGAREGLRPEELLAPAGLLDADLHDPDARIPLSKIENLWRELIRRVPACDVGLRLGTSFSVRDWGLVGYTMAYSRTLGHALERLARYSRIMTEAIQIELSVSEGRGTLTTKGGKRLDALRHPVVARCAAVLGAMREISATEIVPLEAMFTGPRPDDCSAFAEFFRCPLKFDHPTAGLVLREIDLALPAATADETLAGYLEHLADDAVNNLGGDGSFKEKVYQAVWRELSDGKPSLEHTAKALGTSVRTLQRRLKSEGTTFAALLEELRRELASGLVRSKDLAIYEVAYLLGYSEPSTFYRAFRRWHGVSPLEYRRTDDASPEPALTA